MHCYHTGLFIQIPRSKYRMPHLPQRTILHKGLLHPLRSHRSLQSANEPQRRDQTQAQ